MSSLRAESRMRLLIEVQTLHANNRVRQANSDRHTSLIYDSIFNTIKSLVTSELPYFTEYSVHFFQIKFILGRYLRRV